MTACIEDAESVGPAQVVDLGSLLKGIPRGAWIAMSQDRTHVVAFAADMRLALEQAKLKGEKAPIMFRIPEQQGALLL